MLLHSIEHFSLVIFHYMVYYYQLAMVKFL